MTVMDSFYDFEGPWTTTKKKDEYHEHAVGVFKAAYKAYKENDRQKEKKESTFQGQQQQINSTAFYVKLMYGDTWLPISDQCQEFKTMNETMSELKTPLTKSLTEEDTAIDVMGVVMNAVWKNYSDPDASDHDFPLSLGDKFYPTNDKWSAKANVMKQWATFSCASQAKGSHKQKRIKKPSPEEIRFRKLLYDMRPGSLNSISEEQE